MRYLRQFPGHMAYASALLQVMSNVEECSADSVAFCKEFRVEYPTSSSSSALGRLGSTGTSQTSISRTSSGLSMLEESVKVPSAAGLIRPGSVTAAAAPKPLMIFEGTRKQLGCTILLHGGSLQQLVRVKRVVKFAVLAAWHQRLETAYLADALAPAFFSGGLDGERCQHRSRNCA